MANETMTTSLMGLTKLRRREGVRPHYYNDIANHCTYGVGTLVHHGPCTPAELATRITGSQISQQLSLTVKNAEKAVRRHVKSQLLDQDQFDALVSFVFNVGERGARRALEAADKGEFLDVVSHMKKLIYVHPRDSSGRRLPPKRSRGLEIRRREEVAPFEGTRTNQ